MLGVVGVAEGFPKQKERFIEFYCKNQDRKHLKLWSLTSMAGSFFALTFALMFGKIMPALH